MPRLRQELAGAENAILESNSIMRFLRPDLYITVLDAATADFKTSAQEFLDRADAVILHDSTDQVAWTNVSLKPVAGKPMFRIRPPQYVTPSWWNLCKKGLTTETQRRGEPPSDRIPSGIRRWQRPPKSVLSKCCSTTPSQVRSPTRLTRPTATSASLLRLRTPLDLLQLRPVTRWHHHAAGRHASGGEISQSREDRWLMDLLRAHADGIAWG